MLIILGSIQFLMIGLICLYEFKNKSSVVFMWATLFIMFGIMHLLNVFSGDDVYSNLVLGKAAIFVILFCIIYLATRVIIASKVEKDNRLKNEYHYLSKNLSEEKNYDSFLFLILITVMIVKTLPYMKYVGSLLDSSWSTGRVYTATLDYVNLMQVMDIIFFAFSGLTAVFFLRKEKGHCICTIAILIFGVIFSRNRIEILPVICSIIGVYLFKINKVKLNTVIFVLIVGIIVIYVIYGLRVFRHYGTIGDFISNFNLTEFIEKINFYLKTDDGELGLRRDFYHFIAHDNQFDNFGKGHSYLRMLFVYIPTRWSFGLKPDDFAIAMGAAVGAGAGGSTHPTLFGDCYANLNYLGIFLGAFWAVYATIIDKITLKRKNTTIRLLTFILCAVVYCIIGRGSVYNGFRFIAFGIPFLIIIEWSIAHFRFRHIKLTWGRSKGKYL